MTECISIGRVWHGAWSEMRRLEWTGGRTGSELLPSLVYSTQRLTALTGYSSSASISHNASTAPWRRTWLRAGRRWPSLPSRRPRGPAGRERETLPICRSASRSAGTGAGGLDLRGMFGLRFGLRSRITCAVCHELPRWARRIHSVPGRFRLEFRAAEERAAGRIPQHPATRVRRPARNGQRQTYAVRLVQSPGRVSVGASTTPAPCRPGTSDHQPARARRE